MNNEMLNVMLVISPLVGAIIGYIVSHAQIKRRRKSALTVDEDTKESAVDTKEHDTTIISIFDKLETPEPVSKRDKKAAALESISEFRERVMSFSPIKLINEVEVTVVKKIPVKTIDSVTYNKCTKEFNCLKIEFYLDGKYYRETIYSQYEFPSYGHYVYGYEKYSLEELQGYDWIISEMFNIVEEKKEEILKEKLKDIEVEYSVLSHDLVKR